jgi:predicted naringenin-chalcone synthase
LATAVPSYQFEQEEVIQKMISIFSIEGQQADKMKRLYRNTAIQTRHSVIGDFKHPRDQWKFWGCDYPGVIPPMSNRNAIYKQEAPKLAHQAANQALQAWGGDPSAITHIISVSCTGVMAPGIEFELINSLNLPRSVSRLGINFMGCFGAFKGLHVAQSFAKESRHHRILLVCTELCSLHLQSELTNDNIIANALFADGAAAVVVGADSKDWETRLWNIVKQSSYGLEDSLELMTWEAGDHGFWMRLSSQVPQIIHQHISAFTDTLLSSDIAVNECDWAIHPGGKAIIYAIEKALKLEKTQTQAAWETLSNYGNMSSATFLFVLQELLKQKSSKQWSIGIGFGPGLSIEGIVLRKPNSYLHEKTFKSA